MYVTYYLNAIYLKYKYSFIVISNFNDILFEQGFESFCYYVYYL